MRWWRQGNNDGPQQAIRQLTAAGGLTPNAWGSFGRNGVIIGRTDKGTYGVSVQDEFLLLEVTGRTTRH